LLYSSSILKPVEFESEDLFHIIQSLKISLNRIKENSRHIHFLDERLQDFFPIPKKTKESKE